MGLRLLFVLPIVIFAQDPSTAKLREIPDPKKFDLHALMSRQQKTPAQFVPGKTLVKPMRADSPCSVKLVEVQPPSPDASITVVRPSRQTHTMPLVTMPAPPCISDAR